MKLRLPRKLKKRLRTDTAFAIIYAFKFVGKIISHTQKIQQLRRKAALKIPDFKPGGIMHTGDTKTITEEFIITPKAHPGLEKFYTVVK